MNEILNTHFFKEVIKMTSKHVKRYATPLAIRKMQVKTS